MFSLGIPPLGADPVGVSPLAISPLGGPPDGMFPMPLELGEYGVRCNCVSPGLVNQTPFDGGSPELKSSRNVLGRNGYTQEVAQVVSYLINDSYITGQNIIVDGGRSLGLYGDS